jgi:hypothetical protein
MRLLLIEGAPYSGKSTIAQHVALRCTTPGTTARWFHEREPDHPVFQFAHLNELLRFEPDQLEEALMAGWRALTPMPRLNVLVLDGTLMNLTIGLMVAMELPENRIRRVFGDIVEVLQPFEPTLVQLTYPDVDQWLRTVSAQRGAHWIHVMHTLLAQTPFARAHAATSNAAPPDAPPPGTPARSAEMGLLRAFYARLMGLMSDLPELWLGQHADVAVEDEDWRRVRQDVMAVLGYPRVTPTAISVSALLRCAGQFRSLNTRRDVTVTTDGQALFLQHQDHVVSPLIHTGDGQSHLVEGYPSIVTFDANRSDQSPRFHMRSTLHNDRLVTDTFCRVTAS